MSSARTRLKLIVESDGGSRGNPGPAAYGAVVLDAETGELLAEVADFLGENTNNVAEYSGLIAGLTAANQIEPGALIEARLDSKLVVEQISGRWAIKNATLRPLAMQAKELAPVERVSLSWIPRAQNKRADALVNESLDAAARGRTARIARWHDEEIDTDILADAAGRMGAEARAEAKVREEAAQSSAPNRIVGWAGADIGTPTKLMVVRHGVTQMSIEHRFSGRGGIDPPLLEMGRAQAHAVADELAARGGADVIVCSPLVRTRQTAAIISARLGLPTATAIDDFAEANFGLWDGLNFAEVKAKWPAELTAWLSSTDAAPPGGESYSALRRRVARARARLVASNPGKRVILVAHVSPIKSLVQSVLEAPSSSAFRIELSPCSLTTLAWWSDGASTIYGVGESGHLHEVGHPTA